MKNREALLNAGFEKKNGFHPSIKKGDITVFVSPETLSTVVYYGDRMIKRHIAINLKDVKAFCYGHLGYYLDFTAKPKYDWETVKVGLGEKQDYALTNAIYWINEVCRNNKLEARSMIAKLKLNVIIQQIDKDYPSHNGAKNYAFGVFDDELYSVRVDANSRQDFQIAIGSDKGAKILLDQNTQLLQNLFKIETDA